MTVVGNLVDANVGSVLLIDGNWKVDAKYGRQFLTERWEETMPATVFGIEKYLGSGLIKGVGPKFAKKIVQQFGTDTLEIIETDGLQRTGKTTMIRQILTELPETEFRKAAFIQVRSRDTLEDIDEDLRLLETKGFKYVFIDEVTLMEDFIEGAALFSDIYASSGMKIVLSGTDSLGFAFSKEEQLYDRCMMMHYDAYNIHPVS